MKPNLIESVQQCPNLLAAKMSRPESAEGRRRQVLFYSGAVVPRYDWRTDEEYDLSFDMNGAELEELTQRGKVLNSHSSYEVADVLGKVESAKKTEKGYMADLLFSDREEISGIWQDIEAGILTDVSMGVKILELKDITKKDAKKKHLSAARWQPFEISVVAFGADPGARFLAADPRIERARRLQLSADSGAASEADRARYLIQLQRMRFEAGL